MQRISLIYSKVGPLRAIVLVHEDFLLSENDTTRSHRLVPIAEYNCTEKFKLVRVLLILCLSNLVGLVFYFAEVADVMEIIEVLVSLGPWVEDLQCVDVITQSPQYFSFIVINDTRSVFLSFLLYLFKFDILLRQNRICCHILAL